MSVQFQNREKPKEIRQANIEAAKAVADAVRTSLGPKGMDKMITDGNGEVTISNDGATILEKMSVLHPVAKMLVQLSHAQDVEAGDGTTSVVVLCGGLLTAAQKLLGMGIHPQTIAESFDMASTKAREVLDSIAIDIDISDRESLIRAATTSLNSKVVSQNSGLLAPIAVEAVLRCIQPDGKVDLRDIRVIQRVGGTVDDSELIDGLLLTQECKKVGNPPITRVEKAKVGLIQFQLSPPKTDIDNQVLVSDYTAMDRVFKEERNYILGLCNKIKKSGCNVLLIQKSILRDAYNDLALHFLSKMKIMVVTDIERDEIEFIAKTLGCRPVAHADDLTLDKLAKVDLVEEVTHGSRLIKLSGITTTSTLGKTVSILCRGSNNLVLEEAARSLHDAMCVIRCLVKERSLLVGGGAPEIELSIRLTEWSQQLTGMHAYCIRAYAEALEVIPLTLAENAGLNPIEIVTELRTRHANGEEAAGINIRKSTVSNLEAENVLQPLLVSKSAISLATETVCSIMKIDDLLFTR